MLKRSRPKAKRPGPQNITYPWMTCGQCNGKGIVTNSYTGEPDDCKKCGGSGLERGRLANGRFS